eukprot:Stramenopile-MAST_4_protein_2605
MSGQQRIMAVTEIGQPLRPITIPTPVPTGNEVLIKTTYAGLCHSDLHQIDGYFNMGGGNKLPLSRGRKFPFCVGHEIEGTVVAVGPEARGKVQVGQDYGIYPWGGCMKCGECRRGLQNICSRPHANDLGNGKNMYGGFSSHVLVPHYDYCFDKTGIPDGLASTYMCAGLTAYSAMKKIGAAPNGPKDIVIIGLGGVGFQGFQMAKAVFGGAPIAVDLRQEALDVAAREGGTVYNAADKDIVKKIKAGSDLGLGVYGVVDFVGGEKSFALSSSIIRRGGIIVQVGLLGGAMSMPLPLFPLKAMQVKGTLVGSLPECKELFQLLKEGKVGAIPYHIRSIREINNAIEDMKAGRLVGRCIFKHDWNEAGL